MPMSRNARRKKRPKPNYPAPRYPSYLRKDPYWCQKHKDPSFWEADVLIVVGIFFAVAFLLMLFFISIQLNASLKLYSSRWVGPDETVHGKRLGDIVLVLNKDQTGKIYVREHIEKVEWRLSTKGIVLQCPENLPYQFICGDLSKKTLILTEKNGQKTEFIRSPRP